MAEVVRTYLEMTEPSELRAVHSDDPTIRVARLARLSAEGYRQLYGDVGSQYHWHDRDAWSDDELRAYLARPDVAVWVLLSADDVAGYFELVRQPDASVEIAYFGLMPAFIGRGLGKVMLTRAVEEAWRFGASRVWLHTCTLDSPQALPNYEARGFVQYRRETYSAHVPGG
jgi:GNAT superfamily N-acetyltransferase